ncbi:MAG TPA: class I mannose-6-phosphate isomerase [Actinophytocola sp.]|uniref:class I mannose-6-phosphate isomerase n=1 Tax=Actinophytocola sp. TaxID=1872138 RepID=UPI002DDD320F|nr:class I mannose-6-phosphate isomerase [Actinophytocola sp.]HEV2782076.1 class I mannose-6-phosphate isomerase [Actinophytocola sp.]
MKAIRLPANQPPRFYRGGAAIAALRGTEPVEYGPEDWVASCTTLYGETVAGLSALPDGRWLRDAVRADPEHWLGPGRGADPALLVKLLDAGQRLPVHCHPSDGFAKAHLDSRYGKTEAWIVVGTTGPSPTVHIGFREDRDEGTVADWVAAQDTGALLGALNEVAVRPGDAVFVPAGVPHAIGAGVFIVELQQPTDLSIMLEWKGFLDSEAAGHLGLGYPAALGCVDRSGYAGRLDELVRRPDGGEVVDLFGPAAEGFFRAQRLAIRSAEVELEPGYAVLVVLSGAGQLTTGDGEMLALAKGDTVVVPYAAGSTTIGGELVAIRCAPPGVAGG